MPTLLINSWYLELVLGTELVAKYTPRTAAKELSVLAAQILPPGMTNEQVAALAKEVSSAKAKDDLAIAAKELAAKFTPRTAERELLADCA